jgi:peptidoglycan/xylan/chitin deacetylase (PgdA/CDA1 family)
MDEGMQQQGVRLQFLEPTGLMFHHFHGSGHPEVQGSITSEEFEQIILAVGRDNILSAEEWLRRARTGELNSADTCITFDDALLCQYDVAKPVLDYFGITAFWFVYTSIYNGVAEKLEIYRYFRCTAFPSVDSFYERFFVAAQRRLGEEYLRLRSGFNPAEYLSNSPFYTDNDRWFRYLRDRALGSSGYYTLMEDMIDENGFDRQAAAGQLWLRPDHVKDLAENGHLIGLHSYSHPTSMGTLSYDEQAQEYRKNSEMLQQMVGYQPTTAAHPCNSYNDNTLTVLQELDVSVAFRADTAKMRNRTLLEFPREDHANILNALRRPVAASL